MVCSVVTRSVALALLVGTGLAGWPSVAVAAEQSGRALVYDSLPGVKPVNPLGSDGAVRCEQVLIDRARGNILPNNGPRYRTVNVCSRDGGPEFVSPRLPPSIYRQLRGFDY